jgi:hypothetical protein
LNVVKIIECCKKLLDILKIIRRCENIWMLWKLLDIKKIIEYCNKLLDVVINYWILKYLNVLKIIECCENYWMLKYLNVVKNIGC